jgi:3-dehydroquinate dehydratase-1
MKKALDRFRFGRPGIAGSFSDRDAGILTCDDLEALDLIEVRVDLFSEPGKEYLEERLREVSSLGRPLIGTVRSADEGGGGDLSPDERVGLFSVLSEWVDIIDIEIRSELFDNLLSVTREKSRYLLASFHDFDKTPPEGDLRGVMESAYERGADIVKIATMVRTRDDLMVLARLTLDYSDSGVVVIGMGEQGVSSRVFLPMIGSLFTFASVGAEKAPGQIPVLELRRLMNRLGG